MTACTHWWIIETPNGAFSPGRCKLWGAEGQFPNSGREWADAASWREYGAGAFALPGSALLRPRHGGRR